MISWLVESFLLRNLKLKCFWRIMRHNFLLKSWVCLVLLPGFLVTVELVSSGCQANRRWILRICAYMALLTDLIDLPFLLLQSSYELHCLQQDTGCEHHERCGIHWHIPGMCFSYLHRSQFTDLSSGNRYSVLSTAYIHGLGSDHDKKHRKEK